MTQIVNNICCCAPNGTKPWNNLRKIGIANGSQFNTSPLPDGALDAYSVMYSSMNNYVSTRPWVEYRAFPYIPGRDFPNDWMSYWDCVIVAGEYAQQLFTSYDCLGGVVANIGINSNPGTTIPGGEGWVTTTRGRVIVVDSVRKTLIPPYNYWLDWSDSCYFDFDQNDTFTPITPYNVLDEDLQTDSSGFMIMDVDDLADTDHPILNGVSQIYYSGTSTFRYDTYDIYNTRQWTRGLATPHNYLLWAYKQPNPWCIRNSFPVTFRSTNIAIRDVQWEPLGGHPGNESNIVGGSIVLIGDPDICRFTQNEPFFQRLYGGFPTWNTSYYGGIG